jgi:putative GTP pyrophosphokinase
MSSAVSKTSIDALGERLRASNLADDDLRQLDAYRRTFADAYESVIGAVRGLGLEPTGRPAKSTSAIVAKLARETMRLSQMQDIAGCRLIVDDAVTQDKVVHGLTSLFDKAVVSDRRARPSHGYRAVHVVAMIDGRAVEIQVRTTLQHLWAEYSEKFSDVWGSELKYGVGHPGILAVLENCSMLVAAVENHELATPPVKVLEMKQDVHGMMQNFIRDLSNGAGN